jgi:hypothetical protein
MNLTIRIQYNTVYNLTWNLHPKEESTALREIRPADRRRRRPHVTVHLMQMPSKFVFTQIPSAFVVKKIPSTFDVHDRPELTMFSTVCLVHNAVNACVYLELSGWLSTCACVWAWLYSMRTACAHEDSRVRLPVLACVRWIYGTNHTKPCESNAMCLSVWLVQEFTYKNVSLQHII